MGRGKFHISVTIDNVKASTAASFLLLLQRKISTLRNEFHASHFVGKSTHASFYAAFPSVFLLSRSPTRKSVHVGFCPLACVSTRACVVDCVSIPFKGI